jgi:hypothetical protein
LLNTTHMECCEWHMYLQHNRAQAGRLYGGPVNSFDPSMR